MKLHYKMFSVSIAFTLNMKTYCKSQEGFLSYFLFLIFSPFALIFFFFLDSLFPQNLAWILYRNISNALYAWFQKYVCHWRELPVLSLFLGKYITETKRKKHHSFIYPTTKAPTFNYLIYYVEWLLKVPCATLILGPLRFCLLLLWL